MKQRTVLTAAVLLVLIAAPVHAAHPGGTIDVNVNGLVCDFCARALEKVFGKQEAVDTISVDLDTKVIKIHLKEGQSLDDAKITELIQDSGYNVEAIHRE